MSGEDKHIRSSFAVTDVLGEIDSNALMSTVKDKCGAGVLSVDASSKPPVLLVVDAAQRATRDKLGSVDY